MTLLKELKRRAKTGDSESLHEWVYENREQLEKEGLKIHPSHIQIIESSYKGN